MAAQYTPQERTVRLPLLSDLQINSFSTGVATNIGGYIKNGKIGQYPAGDYYTTQRPGFAFFSRPSDNSITDVRGRGCYYWNKTSSLYFVNGGTIYKGDYTGNLSPNIPNGYEKIETEQLGGKLVFVDSQGQTMWYIDESAPGSLVKMSGSMYSALPQNNNLTLAHGVAVLDQTMYVLSTSGQVWGSATANPGDFDNGLNVITAEKEDDDGVYIDKHYDHVVVFGTRTIEFFYGAGNASGSPLSVRQDISYNIGCADPNSVWRNGDDIYFLGIDTTGQIQPYLLRNFQLTPIATGGISSFITTSKSIESIYTIGSGMSSGGTTYYVLTTHTLSSGNISTIATYVYNSDSQIWSEWEFAGSNVDNFGLIGYSKTDSSRIGEGILVTGELLYVWDDNIPYDYEQIAEDQYVADNYVAADYVVGSISATSNAIDMVIRLDNFDNGNRNWKFAHQLRVIADETSASNNITVRWNDGNNLPNTYTGTRTIDMSSNLNKLTRLGRFKSRSFELEYAGTEQIRLKGIDLDITEGTH